MTYEEKLQKVVLKLKEERELTRKGHKTKVVFNDQSFTKVRIREVCKVLLKLQDDEKAVTILDALQPLETVPTEQIINPTDTDDYEFVEEITVEIDEKFDQWYETYLIREKSKPENLEWFNILKILDICSDINQQLQITKNTTLLIPSFPYPYLGRFLELFPTDNIGTRKIYQQHRIEAAQYLQKEGIASEVSYKDASGFGYGNIAITINIVKFNDFFVKINQEFEKRKPQPNKIEENDLKLHTELDGQKTEEKNDDEEMYRIIYTKQRQVLMNNAQISKPDFNSENDLVFSFLYDNPNRRITREEIEKAIGDKLTKTLHKIVENLGFEGDTKEVFFSVSKDAIEFRNPITKKDLEEMKKPLIKLVKGGGKLIIPH